MTEEDRIKYTELEGIRRILRIHRQYEKHLSESVDIDTTPFIEESSEVIKTYNLKEMSLGHLIDETELLSGSVENIPSTYIETIAKGILPDYLIIIKTLNETKDSFRLKDYINLLLTKKDLTVVAKFNKLSPLKKTIFWGIIRRCQLWIDNPSK